MIDPEHIEGRLLLQAHHNASPLLKVEAFLAGLGLDCDDPSVCGRLAREGIQFQGLKRKQYPSERAEAEVEISIDACRHEAKIRIKLRPDSQTGDYIINGGPFQGAGEFVSVKQVPKTSRQFDLLYACESVQRSPTEGRVLRWHFGIASADTPG